VVAGASVAGALIVWLATRGEDERTDDAPAVTADAAPVATVTPDAAAAPVAIDAATVAAVPVDAPAPIEPVPDPVAQIRTAIAEGRIGDALAPCIAGVSGAELNAVCTRAACAANEAVRAKQWLAKSARAERAALITECKTKGIDLSARPKPPRPPGEKPRPNPCKTDPMACQR
jgi:hypothetical protein